MVIIISLSGIKLNGVFDLYKWKNNALYREPVRPSTISDLVPANNPCVGFSSNSRKISLHGEFKEVQFLMKILAVRHDST
jgi:hypothetical protein